MKRIRIPIEVDCLHYAENSGETESVEMKISVCDPEVPTFLAVCSRCGREIIIAFGDFIHAEQVESVE